MLFHEHKKKDDVELAQTNESSKETPIESTNLIERAQTNESSKETTTELTNLLDGNTESVGGMESTSQSYNLFQRVALSALTVITWASGILFSLYIAGYYGGGVVGHNMERWGGLYDKDEMFATAGIGLHFFSGAVVLVLGCIQFIRPLRSRFPVVHKWTGRIYISCSAITATGGLMFMVRKETIGGPIMSFGFSLYGFLILICCYQTYRYATDKNFTQHELWAWRLFSLMIASWLYRIEYMVALLLHVPYDYRHHRFAFDYVMDFFFYLPNLLVVEGLWRLRHRTSEPAVWNFVAVCMLIAAGVVLIATQLTAFIIWLPGMMGNKARFPSKEL